MFLRSDGVVRLPISDEEQFDKDANTLLRDEAILRHLSMSEHLEE